MLNLPILFKLFAYKYIFYILTRTDQYAPSSPTVSFVNDLFMCLPCLYKGNLQIKVNSYILCYS